MLTSTSDKLIKREVQVWSSLDHTNILPLLGYILEEKNFPTLVSEFMENGTALQYVLQHPELDVIGIVSDPGFSVLRSFL